MSTPVPATCLPSEALADAAYRNARRNERLERSRGDRYERLVLPALVGAALAAILCVFLPVVVQCFLAGHPWLVSVDSAVTILDGRADLILKGDFSQTTDLLSPAMGGAIAVLLKLLFTAD